MSLFIIDMYRDIDDHSFYFFICKMRVIKTMSYLLCVINDPQV